jgi:arylformamidase
MKLYRAFRSQSEIDAQYNAGAGVPDFVDWMAWYQRTSEQTRRQLSGETHRFGPTVSEYAEVYPAASPGAPIALFIHGGYWRAGSARDFSFVASGLQARGFCVVVSNYALCPQVSVDEITRQSRALVAWLYQRAADFNGDGERIVAIGHSAGGQQVGMLLATDWQGDYELPADIIYAAVPISGVFDLRPLRYSYLQPTLSLSHETIARQSPAALPIRSSAKILVTAGALESEEFRRQSAEYCEKVQAHGCDAQLWLQPECHHFNAIEGLHSPDSELLGRIAALVD